MLFLLSTLVTVCFGHGRLQVPTTRFGAVNGVGTYENNPTSGTTGTDFVCRNDPPTNGGYPPENKAYAGKEMNVRWNLSAAHVGDCSLYVSYDYNLAGEAKRNMKFFKIGFWSECKDYNNQDLKVMLPDWVPAGRAVFRWDWVALHVFPTLEVYTQCSDAEIVGSANSLLPQQVPSYVIPGIYPVDGNSGVFRHPWITWPEPETFVTGMPCACFDSQLNGCPLLTDVNGPGYIHVETMSNCDEGVIVVPSPVAEPTLAPEPTNAPVVEPTTVPVDIVCPEPTVGQVKGKGNKLKKIPDFCTCHEECLKNPSSVLFNYSAKKKQCVCVRKAKFKKGKLRAKKKKDFVYASLV